MQKRNGYALRSDGKATPFSFAQIAPLSHSCRVPTIRVSHSRGGEKLDKDRIVNALNAIQNGEEAGMFHDELEVAIGVLVESSDALIEKVVQDIREDADSES